MTVAPLFPSNDASMQIAEMNFGLNMLRQSPASQQMVVSPLSVIFALAMVQLGAKGRTKAQINQLISNGADDSAIVNFYSDLSKNITKYSNGAQAEIANGFFLDKKFSIKDDYASTITKRYAAKIEALTFGQPEKAAKVIDDFVSTTTEGKIKNIINEDALNGACSLIVNAVYFKADWQNKFDIYDTRREIFYHSEKKQEMIKFMTQDDEYRLYAENNDVQLLSLPYKDKSYAFNILLPKKRFGLEDLRTQLNGLMIRNLLLQLKPELLMIRIPKMKIETNYKLKEALEQMGITDLFTSQANLTGISDLPLYPLYVSKAAHRALIEVDEEGTTAAAVTYFGARLLMGRLVREQAKMFKADHPFLFILTKDNNPFFIGQYA
ncbi:unnamed protein product [Cylicocyclus nassatus]|uniref:Serpin domain-containing protein n=1 Tax=Cylicocyclus nassatus TaxID=53992 RepID=A0AA36GFD1_CYLNA|nr:unnamed protein product [Cylicocyclus nassatus]